jgi:hypothetical protein
MGAATALGVSGKGDLLGHLCISFAGAVCSASMTRTLRAKPAGVKRDLRVSCIFFGGGE